MFRQAKKVAKQAKATKAPKRVFFFGAGKAEAKGENLTNRLGLVNTSFIKNVAPIQGRSLTVGVRAEF